MWAEAGHEGLGPHLEAGSTLPGDTVVVFTFAECRDRAESWSGSPVEASGSHRGSPGRPVRAPGSFQSATSAPERGRSKSVSMLFKRGVLVPFDPPVNPTGFQAHWELIFPMLDPSAGCLIGKLEPLVH